MKRTIVWFTTDLRLHDNETLLRAIEQSDEVIPVYCLDNSLYQAISFGSKRTGFFRTQFLLESLTDLDHNLRALGSGLILLKGKPVEQIPALAEVYGVQKVFAKKEVAYEELQVQDQVQVALDAIHCDFETFSTSTLYHAADLPFTLKLIPDVFTQFRKRVERDANIRAALPIPTLISSPAIEPMQLPSLQELGIIDQPIDPRAVMHFKGGESSGLQRVQAYLFETKSISTYKETRNEVMGMNTSSKFSPWLSLGCISPRSIYQAIKDYEEIHGANDSTYWMVFELMWRDYFRFMMKKYKHQFFQQHGIGTSEPKDLEMNIDLLENWKQGKTGNDFIDANMLELKHTGFMSNRGRQNVASYFIHELQLDWRYGAAYFEEQLIDYDVSSNWGNWAYLAGVGNDPRPDRVFNTEKQAATYDKHKTYRNLWLNQN